MRAIAGTAGTIASIFIIIAVLFLAPKGFSFAPESPIVTTGETITP